MTLEPDTPRSDLSGVVLEGRYTLGRALGSGGMGTVYAAKQLRLDRDVAIKVLDPALSNHPEAAARFLREAQLLSRIRHPNVIGILDSGESETGLLYCVMDLLIGSDLGQLRARMPEGRMPWPGACDLLAQLADGLAAAHGRGIVHRDVKPSNCFVTFAQDEQPVAKLIDFGVARTVRDDIGPKLTQAGILIGTPSHLAPELITTRDPATPASDLYALGVVAFRLLSGRPPFEAETLFAQMDAACHDEPPSLDDPDLDIPLELQRLVRDMLAKEPGQRPEDARTVAERFRLVAGREQQRDLTRSLELRDADGRTLSAFDLSETTEPAAAYDAVLPDPDPTGSFYADPEQSVEELELDTRDLEAPEPWIRGGRRGLLAAFAIGVAVAAAAAVVRSDDPPPAPASTAR